MEGKLRERETHLGRPTKGKLKGREGGQGGGCLYFMPGPIPLPLPLGRGWVLKSKEAGRVHTTKIGVIGGGGGFYQDMRSGVRTQRSW